MPSSASDSPEQVLEDYLSRMRRRGYRVIRRFERGAILTPILPLVLFRRNTLLDARVDSLGVVTVAGDGGETRCGAQALTIR